MARRARGRRRARGAARLLRDASRRPRDLAADRPAARRRARQRDRPRCARRGDRLRQVARTGRRSTSPTPRSRSAWCPAVVVEARATHRRPLRRRSVAMELGRRLRPTASGSTRCLAAPLGSRSRGAAADRRRAGDRRRPRRAQAPPRCARGEHVESPTRPTTAGPRPDDAPAPFRVAYEDEHLLVVDKPAGVVVHPARGHATGHARRRRSPAARRPAADPSGRDRAPPRPRHLRAARRRASRGDAPRAQGRAPARARSRASTSRSSRAGRRRAAARSTRRSAATAAYRTA